MPERMFYVRDYDHQRNFEFQSEVDEVTAKALHAAGNRVNLKSFTFFNAFGEIPLQILPRDPTARSEVLWQQILDSAAPPDETKERLEAAFGPATPDVPPVFQGPFVLLRLERVAEMPNRIDVAQRLRAAGVTLREAHAVVGELAEVGRAPVRVADGVDRARLASDLWPLHVVIT
jgi:hypothetical protein